jgi:Lhr-like helicase
MDMYVQELQTGIKFLHRGFTYTVKSVRESSAGYTSVFTVTTTDNHRFRFWGGEMVTLP